MTRFFSLLLVNGRAMLVTADLELTTNGEGVMGWEVRADIRDPADLRFLAALVTAGSGAVGLELKNFRDSLEPWMKGQALLIAVPSDDAGVVRFQGTGRLTSGAS